MLRRHALAPDVHERVARRFVVELTPVLDVGCGERELATHLPESAWVGVDASAEMLARAPQPHHLADATALPFPDVSFRSVALLYVLYHLPDPRLGACRGAPGVAIRRARRRGHPPCTPEDTERYVESWSQPGGRGRDHSLTGDYVASRPL